MQAYDTMLCEFIDKYGQYRRRLGDPGPIPLAVALLRMRLITEEMGEFLTDYYANDFTAGPARVNVADALGDLAYVVIGTIVAYGFNCHADEMVRPGGQPFSRSEITPAMGKSMCAVVTLIHEYQMNPDFAKERITNALHDMLFTIIMTAKSLDIPFDEVLREIHRSNMTKAAPTISTEPGHKYGVKIGACGKGPDYQPPNLEPILSRTRAASA